MGLDDLIKQKYHRKSSHHDHDENHYEGHHDRYDHHDDHSGIIMEDIIKVITN